MTISFAYSPSRVADLTNEQLTELNTELLEELRRLSPGPELGAKRHSNLTTTERS